MIKKLTNHLPPAPISHKTPLAGGSPIRPPVGEKPSLGAFVGPKIAEGVSKAIGNLGSRLSILPAPSTANGPSLAGKNNPASHIRFPQLMQKLQGSLDKISQSGQPLPPQFDKIKGLFHKLSDQMKMNPMRGGGVQGLPMIPRKPAMQAQTTPAANSSPNTREQTGPEAKMPFKGPMMDRSLLDPQGSGTVRVKSAMNRSYRPQDDNKGTGHENGNGVNTYNGGQNPASRTPKTPTSGNTPESLTNPTSFRVPTNLRPTPPTSTNGGNGGQSGATDPQQTRAQTPAGPQISPPKPSINGPVFVGAKAMPGQVNGKGDEHSNSPDNRNAFAPSPRTMFDPPRPPINGPNLANPTFMPDQINGKGNEHVPPENGSVFTPPPNPINPPANGGSLWNFQDLSPNAGGVKFGARPDTVGGQGELHANDTNTQTYDPQSPQDTDYARFERDFFSLLQNLSGSGFFSI